MKTDTPEKDYVEIDLGSAILVIAKSELTGCVCQCRRHRLAAKKLAVAISQGLFSQPLQCTDAQKKQKSAPLNETQTAHKNVVTFDEVHQGARPCMYCMYMYHRLLPSSRGDITAESFLQQQYPLETTSKNRKSALHDI